MTISQPSATIILCQPMSANPQPPSAYLHLCPLASTSWYQFMRGSKSKVGRLQHYNTTWDAVVCHLSGPGPCGQWLLQALPNIGPAESLEDEYLDNIDATNDVDANAGLNNPFNDSDVDDNTN
ncbi:hypothetical protein BKA83DRAFT_4125416 [Pisolithus microcarpus]|nr:hypothetical protein BKA83DRAFT_4125416 [Pisolithus microcarpus]